MLTFIFSSEYEVFAANAETKEQAIELITGKLAGTYAKEFAYALKGDVVVIPMGEAVVFDHSNQ